MVSRRMVMEDEFQIPRGGLIYISNLVSPLTTVPDFEASLLGQLQELQTEAEADLTAPCAHDDLSIDELKVYTEEEFVDMALKEAFMDEKDDAQQPSKDTGGNSERSREENTSTSVYSLSETICKDIVTRNSSRKRKKRKENRLTIDSYIGKVEQLAKIKQKQDEDKATASLNSLKSSCKTNKLPTPSLDKVERMKSLRSTNSAKSSDNQEQVAVVYPQTILCIEVYHNKRKSIKTQEFLVLGRQTLTELRDKIYCLADQVMRKAGQHCPSGCFLIEDAFYNDLRDPSAIDYSEPVFHWLRSSKEEALKKWECIINGELLQKQKAMLGSVSNSHLPHYKAFEMHKMRFCDLRFRLGAGYLYCHQGDCKHTLVIRDMRLIHPEDVRNRSAYPIVIFQLKPRAQKCNVCNIYRATRVALDNKWAQENPCYFCDYCYSLLNCKDGSPPHDNVSVYDYLHD